MKIFLFFILLLFTLWTGAAFSAVTEDQVETYQFDNEDLTDKQISFSSLPTAGCSIVAGGFFYGSNRDPIFSSPQITDNQGNTYDIVLSSAAGSGVALLAAASNITSAGTFTVTFHGDVTGPNMYGWLFVKTWCGLAAAAFDRSGTASDPGPQGADANVSTSLATSQANELVVVAASICNSTGAVNIQTPTTGYTTIITESDCNAHGSGNVSWKSVTSSAVQTANWSHDDITGSALFDGWAAAILTLKETSAGATNVRRKAIIIQ